MIERLIDKHLCLSHRQIQLELLKRVIKKSSYEQIIILSHTNVAADEIKDEILKTTRDAGCYRKNLLEL